MRIRDAAIITALALLVWGAHGSAHAQAAGQADDPGPSGVLRVGKLYSFGGGQDLRHGFGMDLRYELYPEAGMDGYVGVLAQGQYETGDAWRFVGGLAGGWGAFGLELGVSHRTATSTYAGSTGLHVAQSLTFGPVSIGGRITVPLVDHIPQNVADAPATQGFEAALTLRMSFGFTVHGQRRNHGCHGGHAERVRDPHGGHHH
ncbi:MAG TPA: hypothetical protein RMH99_10765 [Sandaracinaceae bacterium LLY-WYZ-13_1]|nr:hypothetical protein [Sandaracinaceae bacterium LLY-WYZ-13_1]